MTRLWIDFASPSAMLRAPAKPALAITLLACALAGCAAKKSTTPTGGGAVLAKKVVLSWGISQDGQGEGQGTEAMADIFLATTDETGKQLSHQVGRYKGKCAVITPASEMNALTGVACTTGGGGTEIHAVKRAEEIVVVQLGTTPGTAPDPMAREEVTRIAIPTGIAVEVAPQ